ncbi:hypothetical protein [Listeria booriae]|uniref:hypothetical protein n=1 Tax=Listeria booriae TaxID=1552123 RepID=UPI00163D6146|nr:hypothetical protein [Listeria booriae]MBC1306815.1 hypothetical protein [Listeria booriae]
MDQFYVYVYKAKKAGSIEIKRRNKTIEVKKDDVFYVGKGKGRRLNKGSRNVECERFIKIFGKNIEKVKEDLTEEQALAYEHELIQEITASGKYLTNVLAGQSSKELDSSDICIIKYLYKLKTTNVIKISEDDIAYELGLYRAVISRIIQQRDTTYASYPALCPDNIVHYLNKYKRDVYSEIKYCLDLIDNGVLNMTQTELGTYFRIEPTTISTIKQGDYIPIPPSKTFLARLLRNHDNKETPSIKGQMKYIMDELLKEANITLTDIHERIGAKYALNYAFFIDLKRHYQGGYVEPTTEMLLDMMALKIEKNQKYVQKIS